MKITFLLLVLILFGCSGSNNPSNIKFQESHGQAVILGETINMLDDMLKSKQTISRLEGSLVKVMAVSDSAYNHTEDYCNTFHYVKIKNNKINGIVDGRHVYKIENSSPDTSLHFKNNTLSIFRTSYFGVGVSDEDGLTFCHIFYQPIVLKDENSDFFGWVTLKGNNLSEKASWKKGFPFLELRNDDGAYDQIVEAKVISQGFVLKIHREFQEGSNYYEVLLKHIGRQYEAEYLSYGEVEY